MADEEINRRRELRKRKILEQSEARLSRITSTKRNQEHEASSVKEAKNEPISESFETEPFAKEDKNDFPLPDYCITPEESKSINEDISSFKNLPGASLCSRPLANSSSENICGSSNGAQQRSKAADNYIFPKKVSDTETRSFVRSRSDARRNSTCTQMMIETLQLSSFSLTVFRPWLAALLGICVQMYFLFAGQFLIFQSLLLPYILFEIGIFTWLHHESQVTSRQAPASLISGLLLLYSISPHVISRFNSILYNVQCGVQDLSIYMFSYLFLHFFCENCV